MDPESQFFYVDNHIHVDCKLWKTIQTLANLSDNYPIEKISVTDFNLFQCKFGFVNLSYFQDLSSKQIFKLLRSDACEVIVTDYAMFREFVTSC